jgi:hypothetical protein
MVVLTGKTARGERETKMGRRLLSLGYGEMIARPFKPPPLRLPWALDNGAWASFSRGVPWDPAPFLEDYATAQACPVAPLFVVCPDVVGRGLESLAFSLEWAPRLTALPLYLAVQDGLTPEDVRPHLPRFAGLFVGGSNPWKVASGEAWVRLAHAHNLPCHIGRAGTNKKAAWAQRIGADSIDSCQPLWGYPKLASFAWTLEGRQRELFGGDL